MAALHEPTERHRCSRFAIVQGSRHGDPVVEKRALGPEGALLLRREREMLRRAAGPGVVRCLGLEGDALLLEDAGARNLQQRIDAGPLTTDRWLRIMVQLAEIVGRLHRRRLIHGALAPARVVLGPDGGVTLVHFSEAAPFEEARPVEPARLARLGRQLAWIAPEQTGRMNRPVDARADLYALGAIGYAMLTGTPPFRSTDPLELVHAHLAQLPIPASIANPAVPTLLSDLVQKLLEKDPARRYQNATTLARDLRRALHRWEETGAIEAFELGHGDLVRELPLPDAPYGREKERAELLRALDEAAADGVRVVLLEGEAGVGKTHLALSLRAEALRRGGRFGGGKAAIRASNVPYLALAEALNALVRTVDPADGAMREAVGAAAGPAGSMVTELIPALGKLVGQFPQLQGLGPEEREHLFRTALQRLVRAIACSGPVVLFLDDLQWADPGTLQAFRILASDPDGRHVLFVGSLRPGEIGADHPLHEVVGAVERSGVPVTRIRVGPLQPDAVAAFLGDALHEEQAEVRPLALLVHAKSRGNPLFVQQLLRALQRDGLLVHEVEVGRWRWDLDRIAAAEVSGDVAELMAAQIGCFPEGTQELLQVASCFGHVLRPLLLARLVADPTGLDERIGALVAEGLVVRREAGDLRFVHDRVQQAAYESLPEERRRELHRRIGAALLDKEGDDALFRATDQLNAAGGAGEDAAASLERARLNQRAGASARASAAYRSALAYYETALDILSGTPRPRELLYDLHRDAAEAAWLAGALARADRLAEEGLPHASDIAETAALQAQRIAVQATAGQLAEAIALGSETLRALFGEVLPSEGFAALAAAEHQRIRGLLAGRSPAFLLERPFDAPPEEQAYHLVVSKMLSPAWFAGTGLAPWLAARAVARVLERGLSVHATGSFANLPIYLVAHGDFVTAEAFADTAVGLARKAGARAVEASALHLQAMVVLPWRLPFKTAVTHSRQAFRLCVETGRLADAANAWIAVVIDSILGGVELDRVLADIEEGLAFLRRVGNEAAPPFLELERELIRSLQGRSRVHGGFGGESFDEDAFERKLREKGPVANAIYRILRLRIAHLYRDFEVARLQADAAMPQLEPMRGLLTPTEYFFATPLLLLAGTPDDEAWARIHGARAQLLAWEASCPENFRARRLLVDAEIDRVEGRTLQAMERYEEAVDWAVKEGLVHDAALASELAGRHYLAIGRKRAAAAHLADARAHYTRWGAAGKVRALDRELGAQLGFEEAAPGARVVAGLDASSLLEAVESISSEIRFERLLPKLVEVCIRAVGADRGVLVLEERGTHVVRAAGSAGGAVTLREEPLAASDEVPATLLAQVCTSGSVLLLDDVRRDPAFRDDPWFSRHPTLSVLAFPLRRKEERMGCFYFEHGRTTHAFAAERLQVLELLAPEIAVALENARLFRDVQRETEERSRAERQIRFLAEASVVLGGSLDTDATLQRLAHLAVPELADWCVIDLVGDDGTVRRVAGAHRDPTRERELRELLRRFPPDSRSPQPATAVLRSGRPLLFPELDTGLLSGLVRSEEHLALLLQLGLRSCMVAPLGRGGRVIGALTCAVGASGRSYTGQDLALAEELARRASIAVENARLYRASQEAVQVREEFLSVASHELKTPITAIAVSLGTELRKRQGGGDDSLRRTLATVDRGLKRLNQLVDQLLDVSHLGAGDLALARERFDLRAVVTEVVEAAQERSARSGSTVEVLAPEPVEGWWDRRRLGEVVANLLDNALKFGEGKPIRIALERRGGAAWLEVRDLGIGIPGERLPHVFERFERGVSSRHFGGWGLGLYLVRRIVEAHGGSVAVASEAGEGATFTVVLPLEAGGA